MHVPLLLCPSSGTLLGCPTPHPRMPFFLGPETLGWAVHPSGCYHFAQTLPPGVRPHSFISWPLIPHASHSHPPTCALDTPRLPTPARSVGSDTTSWPPPTFPSAHFFQCPSLPCRKLYRRAGRVRGAQVSSCYSLIQPPRCCFLISSLYFIALFYEE